MSIRAEHWNAVYQSRSDPELSWTQPDPTTSLALIREVCPAGGRVLDVGGGTSLLAERLLNAGYRVAVLDIAQAALDRARLRLGERASEVRWILGDVTGARKLGEFDVWHDRAVFHFLIDEADRRAYAAVLASAVPPAGHAVVATFAPQGPEQCSGLAVRRYDGAALAREFAPHFELVKSVDETHQTPWGKSQAFQYSLLRRAKARPVGAST